MMYSLYRQKTDFSLFTTMRYTTDSKRVVEERMIPLWPYHLRRLKEAHAYFVKRDGGDIWGIWPGDEAVWGRVKDKLGNLDKGDYRVCSMPTIGSGKELRGRFEYSSTQAPRWKYKHYQLLLMLVSRNFHYYCQAKVQDHFNFAYQTTRARRAL
jgi:hypothetical protein